MCDHFSAGHKAGRRTRVKPKGRGRSNSTNIAIIKAIFNALNREDLECPICCCILCQPVQLACDSVLCAACCKKWVQTPSGTSCPCCHRDHPFNPSSIRTPSKLLLNLLDNLLLICMCLHHHLLQFQVRNVSPAVSSSVSSQRAMMEQQ